MGQRRSNLRSRRAGRIASPITRPRSRSSCVHASTQVMRTGMTSGDDGEPRLRRAVILAPLFAPLTIVVGSAVHAAATTGLRADGPGWALSLVLVTLLVTIYGAPLAYGATALLLWPAAALLRDAGALRWWYLGLIGGVGGAFLFPAYLHALDPRGTWGFFPGAGFAAGAVVGWAFWFIATGRRRAI
jgi:hypothetical protein